MRALVGAGKTGVSSVPGGGNLQLDQRHDALVDVQLGHALGRVGEVAQDRREPLLEEHAVGVVAGVVDRALAPGGSVPVKSRIKPVVALGERHPLGVQARRIDAVVLGVVLPDVGAVGDLAEELTPERLGRALQDRLEARLDLLATVAAEQVGEPLGAHPAGRDLGVEIAAQAIRAAASCAP